MIDVPLTHSNIARYGFGKHGMPLRFEERPFDYSGIEAVPDISASDKRKCSLNLKKKEEVEPGWRATIQAGGLVVAIVLCINVAILIYAYVKEPSRMATAAEGNIVLYAGSCDTSDKIKTWSHIGINILGTLLLVTSGATMQVLSAPTREDIDRAHGKGSWLDIGILSVGNLFRIPKIRVLLWIVLTFSSIPLHLLYNSAIFSTISGNDTLSMLVTADFATNTTWDDAYINVTVSRTINETNNATPGGTLAVEYLDMIRAQVASPNHGDQADARDLWTAANHMRQAAQAKALTRLSPTDCLKSFAPQIVSNYRNVVLVTTLTEQPQTVIDMAFTSVLTSPDWTCNDMGLSYLNTTDWMRACLGTRSFNRGEEIPLPVYANTQQSGPASSPPGPDYFSIDHCLAEPVEGNCSIQLYPILMMVVIAANVVKLLTIFYVARFLRFKPIVTIGDAVVEFMANPDPRTKGAGPLSRDDVRKVTGINAYDYSDREPVLHRRMQESDDLLPSSQLFVEMPLGEHASAWTSKRRRWFAASSKTRWIIVMTLCWAGVATGVGMLALSGNSTSVGDAIKSGFGVVAGAYVIVGMPTGAANVLLANTPQIIISNIYVFYNGLLTTMLLSSEFMDFAKKAKPMRVSPVRKGEQRSTYYLQLPYRYSLPLMALMTTLHWMTSESFFLVHIDSYAVTGKLMTASMLDTIGYSGSAILASTVLSAFIVLIPLVLGFRRFPADIPLVGNCSIAISAACHPARDEPEDVTEGPLRYGVLRERGLTGRLRVGFSSKDDVDPLVDGEIYDTSRCMMGISHPGKHLGCCMESWSLKDVPPSSSYSSKENLWI